ncbi:MAG: LON peptidase substrate-binding domain-containing protein, partial [Gammaproteobacteria bacterium]|nr:LON peptidase substrate-binding domain-containing protein [Gammaproteobacteria bacterium]
MDIDQEGEILESGESEGSQIILPGEALPGLVSVLPLDLRPFFPGQAIPLVKDAELWLPTLQAVQERKQDVIGLIATKKDGIEQPAPGDLYTMGTMCRIHRVHREGSQIQILLEGLQRFSVRQWLSDTAPLMANARYYPDRSEVRKEAQTEEQKAYAVAIINTIKELIPLNPLYGEELKVFLARSDINEPSMLADFAASLTSASKEDLQQVLETVSLQRRMEKVVELLHRELKIAQAQMEIREHVEQEIQGHQREAILKQQLKFIQQELGIAKDD